MQAGHFAHDGETQPAAWGTCIAGAVEAFEYLLAVLRRYADAGVAHFQEGAAALVATTQGDAASGRRRGYGIVGEIPQRFSKHPAQSACLGRIDLRAQVDAGGVRGRET